MKKFKPVILTSVISAIIFLLFSSWIFDYGWSILPYLVLVGCFMVWVQKENTVYKFLIKLVVGSLIFGFLSTIFIFLRTFIMSNYFYDNPMPIFKLWDQDVWMMASIFSFISFLGGLIGIVLKGLYCLYKNKLDLIIIFFGPLLIMLSSIAFYKIKIGGTLMSAVHGWPYPFFVYQIQDILDGFSIDKWIFSPGSFYHYVIFNYFFYLAYFLATYFVLQLINKRLKLKKINVTFVLFGFLVVVSICLISFIPAKRSYISSQIAASGYCQQDFDCKIIANSSPFSCAIVVNQDNAERILKLVNSFPSTQKLECLGDQKAICFDRKCRVLSYDKGLNERNWERLKQAIENCDVSSVMQTHSLQVSAILKNGKMIMAFEPEIDDIFNIVNQAKEKCGQIRMATE